MKKIRLPNPIIMIFGSMGAFWLADIINPGFNPVGIMILLLVPILIVEILYPQHELEHLEEQIRLASIGKTSAEPLVSGELQDE